MHIYDPYGWIVRSLSSLILIYVGTIYVGTYCPIQFQIFKELQRYKTMSNIKHQRHGASYLNRNYLLYESSYVPNYAISYFFQNYSLDVWQDSE